MGLFGESSDEAITSIGFITQDLECTEAEQHMEEAKEEVETNKTIIWIILISCGAVIVVGALIVVIVQCIRKRKTKKVQTLEIKQIHINFNNREKEVRTTEMQQNTVEDLNALDTKRSLQDKGKESTLSAVELSNDKR